MIEGFSEVRIVAAFVALLAIGGTAYAMGYFKSREQVFYEACVEVLKERLKSPSSYHLLKQHPVRFESMTFAEYMRWNDKAEEKKERREHPARVRRSEAAYADGGAYKAQMLIEYEASNSYGASLRSSAACETRIGFSQELPTKHNSFSSISIDGQTPLDAMKQRYGIED